ncbi:MAG TPA: hypothetical protein VMT45_13345 [Thermoanaerobaculaceae bacterium]|nr:hypothetical protein [Thermoanaerobaculaceae bacterium]
MKLITLDRRWLTLSVVDESDLKESATVVRPTADYLAEPQLQDILRDHYYHLRYLRDRRLGRKVKYCLRPEDPWEVACAALVWQGILQGLSWDAVKLALAAAWKALRGAPVEALRNPRNRHTTETQVGLSIEKFGRDGKAQYRLFAGLRRTSRKMSGADREAVLTELAKSNKIDRRARARARRAGSR